VTHLIGIAGGKAPADLLLKGAWVANVLTSEVYPPLSSPEKT